MTINRLRLSHDALGSLLQTAFPDSDYARNPGGKFPKAPRGADGKRRYLALEDDEDPEVLATLLGPVFDLQAEAAVVIARTGDTKDERAQAAWEDVDALNAALGADPTLGGVVDDARAMKVGSIEAGENDWMAGGLEVRVRLLFTAPTAVG